jgi:uncharacterized protein
MQTLKRTLGTVILKPTKGCNADCSYCCAPPDGAPKWSMEDFKAVFDALEPRLLPGAHLIWHGGEPMLLGTKFYEEAYVYATDRIPTIRFSMQSNMLSYNQRWNDVFHRIFKGSLSTSWDPDEQCRTVKGSAELYSRLYHDKHQAMLQDGWRPMIISTISEETAHLCHDIYDRALAADQRGTPYDIRLNYRYPAGRASETGPAIEPATYTKTLLEIYERWLTDAPRFTVTPLNQMFLKVAGSEIGRCPWAKGCTGHIVGIEPNFDVHNCGEFADLAEPQFTFGNLIEDGIEKCLTSNAARTLAMRRVKVPESCKSCIHFAECEGGCMRDSVLFDRGVYGKFFYCETWQEIFSRIKESIITGEADNLCRAMKLDPEMVRATTQDHLNRDLSLGATNMRRPVLSQGYMPTYDTLHGKIPLT